MANYRTRPFIKKLEENGVLSRTGGSISINTLVGLETKLKLDVKRLARDKSRIWTDEHLERIKEHWLRVAASA